VAEKVKKDRYYQYIEKFGFGQLTGIDVPGEVPGLVRKPESWSAIDLATQAFGQGISTTPLQLVMAYAAIANGGFLMRPYVARRVLAPDGQVVVENQPHVVRRVISEKTAKLLASMLQDVTSEGGTGVMANLEGFEVAGKTGTAQKADPVHGGYAAKKRVGSFVGFVPANNPRLVALVLIDEPEVNVYGGIVAAPVFRNIAQGALRRLAVAPDKVSPLPVAENQPERVNRRPMKRINPAAGPNDGTPDFVGLSLREALEKAQTLRVKLRIQGNGYVVKQSRAPGKDDEEVVLLNLQG
jgi:cell division protein FtsI (penicillin-binding protein 3)